MRSRNYWTRKMTGRLSRRRILQGGAGLGAGAAGIALVGCGDDDDDDSSGDPTATTAAAEPTSTSAPGQPTSTKVPDPTATPQPTAAADQVDQNATITVSFGSFPSSLDISTAAGSGGQAAGNAYHSEQLFAQSPGRAYIQGGNADFEWLNDNKTFRIKVRPGIEFHNGEPLDAEAVKFYFDRNLGRAEYNPDFQSANKARMSWMRDIEIVDDMTVDVHSDAPYANAPEQSGGGNFRLTPRQYIIENGDEHYAQNPVGIGPLKFESWIPDQEMQATRNENYAWPDGGVGGFYANPQFERLISRFIPEQQAALAALEAGEIDIANRIGPDLADAFADREGFRVHVLPDTRVMAIELPINWATDPVTGGPNPWRDIRVRQAANYAIDTQSIIDNLLTGTEERAYPPFAAGYPIPLGSLEAPYEYDPARAKALLEEAGQVGFEFEILLATGLWTADTVWMPAIQQMLNDVGFKATVAYEPLSEALTLMRDNKTQGPFIFNQGSTTKGSAYVPSFGWSLICTVGSPYSHAQETDDFLPEFTEFQRLVDEANTIFDETERNDVFQEAAVIHYENAFNVPLFNLSHLHVTTDKIIYNKYFDLPTGMNHTAAQKLI